MRHRLFTKPVLDEARAIAFSTTLWQRPQVPGLTIDGPESRDLDDAIWIQAHPNGVLISVHIADVSECIPQGSHVDSAALERTQTRYLKRGNDPMIPSVLSEQKLSLQAGQARPTLTVNITLNAAAHIETVEIHESWISSLKQWSYPEVDLALQSQDSTYSEFFKTCLIWAERLYQQRTDPETLNDPSIPEGAWLDENGHWVVSEGTRYHAHLIIQEFMILANTAIAQWLSQKQVPAIYRNHKPRIDASPSVSQNDAQDDAQEKPQNLSQNLSPQAPQLDEPNPHKLLQSFIEAGWDRQLCRPFESSLDRAEYEVEPIGHFALKLSAYGHFTSPIRRLADLINHRIIKALLRDRPHPYTILQLQAICAHIEQITLEEEAATKDFFKARHIKIYQRQLLNPDEIKTLEPKDFSLLLRYAVTHDQLAPMEQIVQNRLRAGQLLVEDQFVLLFLGEHLGLKQQILAQLKHHPFDAPSILSIAQNQLEECEGWNYEEQVGESSFAAWLNVVLDGKTLTTQEAAIASRKQKARHQACMQWLEAYVYDQLVEQSDRIQPEPISPATTHQAEPIILINSEQNSVSQLNELCQRLQWDAPSYTFFEDEDEFLCEGLIFADEEPVMGFGSSHRKNIAKRAAALQILEQVHPKLQTLSPHLQEAHNISDSNFS